MTDRSTAPLVSVIIPAYNEGKLLARAIESALAQTYSNIEIIVVNDGSTSAATRETADKYRDEIVYVERTNGGVAAARNTGLENSRGRLIALLDQDDVWLPDKLEKQVAIFERTPGIALVHSSYYLIDKEGRRTGVRRLHEGAWEPLPSLLLDVPVSSCTTLFPRRIIDEVGRFDPSLNGSDDWDLWLRMAAQGYRFYCVGEPLAEYRVHEEMTSQDNVMMLRAGFAVLDKFYSQPACPEIAAQWKDRAYFAKHAWAVSIYYGLGRLDEARTHLRAASRLYPEGVATIQFARSLVQARAGTQVAQPSKQDAREAIRFVVAYAGLLPSLRKKLIDRGRLVLALYSSQGSSQLVKNVALTALRHPALALDREVRAAARRLLRRTL